MTSEEPVLRAAGLGLRTKRGPVFDGLSLEVAAGSVVALCGPAGSGRSMALLALSGRAAVTSGALEVAGAATPAAIRRHVAVARIGGAVGLEPDLTVGDLVRERRLFGARGDAPAFDPKAVVGDLPALDALLLAVALAAMDEAAVVVVDDVDLGLDDAGRAAAWSSLLASGLTVVATAAQPPAAQPPAGVAVIMMGSIPCAS